MKAEDHTDMTEQSIAYSAESNDPIRYRLAKNLRTGAHVLQGLFETTSYNDKGHAIFTKTEWRDLPTAEI